MYTPIVSLHCTTIFLTSSILILNLATPSSPSLIQRACSRASEDFGDFDTKQCTSVLRSEQYLPSIEDKYDLAKGIIESGISNSTNTRAYIESIWDEIGGGAGLHGALLECKLMYDRVIKGFGMALIGVKRREYIDSSYALRVTSSDYVIKCEEAMSFIDFEDAVISRGNAAVPIFALSACSIVEDDLQHASPPLPLD